MIKGEGANRPDAKKPVRPLGIIGRFREAALPE